MPRKGVGADRQAGRARQAGVQEIPARHIACFALLAHHALEPMTSCGSGREE